MGDIDALFREGIGISEPRPWVLLALGAAIVAASSVLSRFRRSLRCGPQRYPPRRQAPVDIRLSITA